MIRRDQGIQPPTSESNRCGKKGGIKVERCDANHNQSGDNLPSEPFLPGGEAIRGWWSLGDGWLLLGVLPNGAARIRPCNRPRKPPTKTKYPVSFSRPGELS
ncbi:hypothetical protein CLAIMM_06315, partial [Cladophialophora immunda]